MIGMFLINVMRRRVRELDQEGHAVGVVHHAALRACGKAYGQPQDAAEDANDRNDQNAEEMVTEG